MSAAKNITEKGPTLGGILFAAALLALAGAILGFLFLISYPPKAYSSVKDRDAFLESKAESEVKPGELYYLKGPVSPGNGWKQKREVLLNGTNTTLEITAGELNAWMASKFRQASPPSGEDPPNFLILPGVPNFFVDVSEGIFLSLPTEVTIYGSNRQLVIFAQGHFTQGAEVAFQMDALHVNNAAVPVLGGLANQVAKTLLKAYSETDEFIAFRQAWENVESVEVVAGSIRLKLG